MATPAAVVLVIEDEPHMRRFLRATLKAHEYQVGESATARQGLARGAGRSPDAVLLDLGLPDADGKDVVRTLRATSATPIIVISARGQEHERVALLDLGADDYLTKPFSVAELLARIRVALRHAARPDGAQAQTVFEAGELRVDPVRRQVFRNGTDVHLTPTEYKLLSALVRHAGRGRTPRPMPPEGAG